MSRQRQIVAHDEQAEAVLLGAAMLSVDAFRVAVQECRTDDFYFPAYAAVHAALCRLYDAGIDQNIDPVLVADEMTADDLEMIGGPARLMDMMSHVPSTSNAARYAEVVASKAQLRRAQMSIGELYERLKGQELSMAGVRENIYQIAEGINFTEAVASRNHSVAVAVNDFVVDTPAPRWFVRGLFQRQDRLLVTGYEGHGKSVLLRQMAFQLAYGVHPFRPVSIPPCRCLLVDLENNDALIAHWLKKMRGAVPHENRGVDPQMFIASRPEGIDLLSASDAMWLRRLVHTNQPDVVFIGPLYRMSVDDPNEEQVARRVARVIDSIRVRYDTAFVIEGHSAKGSQDSRRGLVPFGASMWMRWPEFGYGMRPVKDEQNHYEWEQWRGPRDARDFPAELFRGGTWPWSVVRMADEAF